MLCSLNFAFIAVVHVTFKMTTINARYLPTITDLVDVYHYINNYCIVIIVFNNVYGGGETRGNKSTRRLDVFHHACIN